MLCYFDLILNDFAQKPQKMYITQYIGSKESCPTPLQILKKILSALYMKSGSMPLSTSNDNAHAYIFVQNEIVSLWFFKIWQIKLTFT